MRKIMESKNEDLTSKKREVLGLNFSLRSKLESLKILEKEIYDKLVNVEDKSHQKLNLLENEYLIKNRERLELDSNNRLAELDIKNELIKNKELQFFISNNEQLENLILSEYEKEMETIENITQQKTKQYEETNIKIVNKLKIFLLKLFRKK